MSPIRLPEQLPRGYGTVNLMKIRCLNVLGEMRDICLCIGMLAVLLGPAHAESSSMPAKRPATILVERYPAGSIRSVEMADQALKDASQERSSLDARFSEEQRACYPKFFATSCLEDAKERHREARVQLKAIEIEAKEFKRRVRVEERDRNLAERLAHNDATVATNTEGGSGAEVGNSSESGDGKKEPSASRVAQTGDNERVARHQAKLEREKAQDVEAAGKRAANIAAYEKKVRDAAERQREIEAKKRENSSK